jgi:hypothetical protein
MAEALPAEAAAKWQEIFGHMRLHHAERELEEQQMAFAREGSEEAQNRLIAIKGSVDRLRRGEPDSTG